jgi:hypothetical protein
MEMIVHTRAPHMEATGIEKRCRKGFFQADRKHAAGMATAPTRNRTDPIGVSRPCGTPSRLVRANIKLRNASPKNEIWPSRSIRRDQEL